MIWHLLRGHTIGRIHPELRQYFPWVCHDCETALRWLW